MTVNQDINTERRFPWLKIACYAICVILVVFYVAILFSPRNVCIEYELYYVTGELSEWPRYGGLDYKLGEKVYLGSENASFSSKRKGTGWSLRENGFSWTSGKKASVLFKFENDVDMTATINVGEMRCQSYDIQINGNVVLSGATVQNGILSVDIPSGLVDENGLVYFTFVPNFSENSNGGLGIQVRDMTITERG